MKLYGLLAPVIIFIYGVRRLRRAPSDTVLPRRSKFYDCEGQEWDLEVPVEAEVSEVAVIWAAIAGMESYVASP
jgi:hypothetical protein